MKQEHFMSVRQTIYQKNVPEHKASYTNAKMGCHCTRSPKMPSCFRTSYCTSQCFRGPQLFNILSKSLKDWYKANVGVFNAKLYLFLLRDPDEPTSLQVVRMREATANSFLISAIYKRRLLIMSVTKWQCSSMTTDSSWN